MAYISAFFYDAEDNVELADGSLFPERFEAGCNVDGLLLDVHVSVVDGVPQLDRVTIHRTINRATGESVAPTQAVVRSVPLDDVVAFVIEQAGRHAAKQAGQRPSGSGALRAYGHRGVTTDLLREVAAIVRGDLDGQPNKAVVARFGVSPRTASRWIKRAEQFITETED